MTIVLNIELMFKAWLFCDGNRYHIISNSYVKSNFSLTFQDLNERETVIGIWKTSFERNVGTFTPSQSPTTGP